MIKEILKICNLYFKIKNKKNDERFFKINLY
jgi:hypothetical protein